MRRCAVLFSLVLLVPVVVMPLPVRAQKIIPRCDSLAYPVAPVAPIPDSTEHRYSPESRHTINFGFKAFWEAHGGLPIFGFPVQEEHLVGVAGAPGETAEMGSNEGVAPGRTIQWFERARFEWHPEFKGTPFEVELGLVGTERAGNVGYTGVGSGGTRFASAFQSPPIPALDPPFQAFWYANGGLSIFGYPISHPFTEYNGDAGRELTVQYFQRARMEVHAELPGSPILLGRVGGYTYPCLDENGRIFQAAVTNPAVAGEEGGR